MDGCGLGAGAAEVGRGRSRHRAPNRDLIIRMLAEVFRVRQTEEGAVRWEQVSSSLVPVSLYSRTTETWLNRLTSDLPIGQAASTMSPDSHRLLLLLHLSSSSQKFARAPTVCADVDNHNERLLHQQQQHQGRVVFQVVAHDFHGGRFWTLLNSKILQPGTKLGYGSDYFVYWKDTQPAGAGPQSMSQSASQSPARCCQARPAGASAGLRQTWGLNFASVNDAKLFYDVCSMNPVNLSFNPAFLKRFSRSIGGFHQSTPAVAGPQRMLRNHTDSDLKSMGRQSTTCSGGGHSQHSNNICGSVPRQHSSPRKQRQTAPSGTQQVCAGAEFVCHDQHRINSCIAQLRQSDLHRSAGSASNFRSRSCSTSRRKSGAKQHSLDRNLSRSTHRLPGGGASTSNNNCVSSDYGSFNTPATSSHQHQQFVGAHNPNCETLLREQELLREQCHFHNYMCPKKPARGHFRGSPAGPAPGLPLPQHKRVQQVSPLTPEIHQVTDEPAAGYISDQTGRKSGQQHADLWINEPSSNNRLTPIEVDQRASLKFLESRSNQRRSTAVDTSSINRFNASLARAKYAKSKNLSLDAGAFQSTPTPTHPVNWGEARSRQTNTNEESCSGPNLAGEEQRELVPINLSLNNEVTCIKLHQDDQQREPKQVQPALPSRKESKTDACIMTDSAAGQVQSSSSIDYQLQMEALNVAVPYGFDEAATNRCEASTTTDDLPLDPIVRKRMFQLTVAKAEREIADRYSSEQESYLQSERLIRTMNEFTSFQPAHKTGAGAARRATGSGPEMGQLPEQTEARRQPQIPEPPLMLQVADLPRPSFSAHQGDLSDSSFVSSPDAEAVAFSMRPKRRVSRGSSSGHGGASEMRSKTMPNIAQHQAPENDDYACCLDMIGRQHLQKEPTTDSPQQQHFEGGRQVYVTEQVVDDGEDDDEDPEYHYDAAMAMDGHQQTSGSHQLCYMQKLSNTLSSVSDFEH